MKRSILRRSAALFLGLVISAALAEVILRQLDAGVQGAFVFAPSVDLELTPNTDVLHGIEGPSRLRTTADGLRGDDRPSGEHRSLLFVGGSTTECLYLDQDETWPERVGRRLSESSPVPVWIANAGRSGASARHHPLQLEAVLARQQDFDWVVVLVGVNDLGTRLMRDEAFDPRFTEDEANLARLRSVAFQLFRPSEGPWHRRSALWHVLRRISASRASAAELQDPSGAVYSRWREHRLQRSGLRTELPPLEEALAEYARHIDRLVGSARLAGARVLLATQPVLWRDDLPPALAERLWMGGVGDFQSRPGCDYYAPAALAEGMRAFDRVLLEREPSEGVIVLDLALAVERTGEHFYDDCHFTEAGAAAAARAVAAELERHPPFGP